MLIQQKATEFIFRGEGVDKVGPGNYNMPDKKHIAGPIVEWKKPSEPPKKIQVIQQQKKGTEPGPGSYNLKGI